MALPLLLILLLAGCPHNNSIETRTLSYDANLPEGHSLSSGTLPGTKVYMKGAKVVVAAAGELITTEGDVGSGWNTMPDGSGDNYFEGQTITLDSNITLYATYGATQRILNSAEAAQLINELQPDESVDILITDKVDFDSLRIALSSTKGKVELDLVEAENLTSITANAFQGATGVFSVTLPNTVTSIESNAFANSGLKSLILEEGKADSITKIDESAIPDEAKIYVPDAQLSEYKSKFPTLSDKIVSDIVTITVKYTGAGTSTLQTEFKGAIGTRPEFSEIPQAPSNFTFVKWVDDSGKTLILPIFKPDLPTVKANATFVNAAGYPVYPAYLTVQRTSYTDATDADTSTTSTKGVGKMTGVGGKTYSQQIANHPKDDGYMTSTGSGYGLAGGMGSYRIPALTKLEWGGGTRIFAAFDVRYRGQTNGGGDVGDTSTNGNDVLIMYSDDGGATWPGKYLVDVKNSWGKSATLENSTAIDTDIGDPQLFVSGSNVYMIAAGGGGILGAKKNNILCNTRIWESTDGGVSWQEITTSDTQSFAFKWDTLSPNGIWNLGGPGHGILLTKPVPSTSGSPDSTLVAGTVLLPMQGGDKSNHNSYFVAGTGRPSESWKAVANSKTHGGKSNDESQVCQLDDGTLLLAVKQDNKTTIKRFFTEGYYTLGSDPWTSGGASQMSLLKVKDGDGSSSYGVVALCNPRSGGDNGNGDDDSDKGRGNVIVSFARDKTGRESIGTNTSPLGDERYYINIRAEKQRYFGYSDMVMVGDEMLGLLYECCHRTEEDVDGMRFITIDVSEILQRLSYSN